MTTFTTPPFGLYVADTALRTRLRALSARYGYDVIYPITADESDADTVVVLHVDKDRRLYLAPAAGYVNAEHLRWPVLFDTYVMRDYEVTEPGLYAGLIATLGVVAAEMEQLPSDKPFMVDCQAGCGMRTDPDMACCWCADTPPILPPPTSLGWPAMREQMRAVTAASRRECQICGNIAATDPRHHAVRFAHTPVVTDEAGELWEFDGSDFDRAVVITPDGSTVAAGQDSP